MGAPGRAVTLALALAAVVATSCREHGTCVWTPDRAHPGVQHCRDDQTRASCDGDAKYVGPSTFSAGKKCPAIGFPCLGDGFDAAYRHVNADGRCPPGSELPGAPARPAKSVAPPGGPTPDPVTHPCVVDNARFAQALKDRDDSCRNDADCACYNGGMEASGCGGVTSKKTATRLTAIAEDFRKNGCRSGVACAAWSCQPKCAGGRCRNGP